MGRNWCKYDLFRIIPATANSSKTQPSGPIKILKKKLQKMVAELVIFPIPLPTSQHQWWLTIFTTKNPSGPDLRSACNQSFPLEIDPNNDVSQVPPETNSWPRKHTGFPDASTNLDIGGPSKCLLYVIYIYICVCVLASHLRRLFSNLSLLRPAKTMNPLYNVSP